MKHIVRNTHYWLFKKINKNSKYYYIRTETDGMDRIGWFIGYENNFNKVSGIGGNLSDEMEMQLENEFQTLRDKI